MRASTKDLAVGKWGNILSALTKIPSGSLRDKHGPCPMCGGNDRFRFDDKDGSGSYYCNQCGAGSGFDLLMGVTGWDFATAAREVDRIIGNVDADPPKKARMSDEECERLLNNLWTGSLAVREGDPVWSYLNSRTVLTRIPDCIRYVPECPVPGGGKMPAMIAKVRKSDGDPVNIHRTFLGENGKADMPNPRAMMPGKIPAGAAIRLFPVHGDRLGIAEGIETAFAASRRFNLPVWSAVNSTMLSKWTAPPNVKRVTVFGDNDPKYGGQAAAFALAHRLATRDGLEVEVRIPNETGLDWADCDAG